MFFFQAAGVTFPRVITQKMQKVLSLQACENVRTNHSASSFPSLKSAQMYPLLWLVEQKPQLISREKFKWASDLLHFLSEHPWKSDSCGLESEHKKVLTSSVLTLACVPIDIEAFWIISGWLLSENQISHIFPSPGGLRSWLWFSQSSWLD